MNGIQNEGRMKGENKTTATTMQRKASTKTSTTMDTIQREFLITCTANVSVKTKVVCESKGAGVSGPASKVGLAFDALDGIANDTEPGVAVFNLGFGESELAIDFAEDKSP